MSAGLFRLAHWYVFALTVAVFLSYGLMVGYQGFDPVHPDLRSLGGMIAVGLLLLSADLAGSGLGMLSSTEFIMFDVIFLLLLLLTLMTGYFTYRSLWRAVQHVSVPLMILPLCILTFDKGEFNIQFAQALIPLGLGWFTNADLLMTSSFLFIISTASLLRRRPSHRRCLL